MPLTLLSQPSPSIVVNTNAAKKKNDRLAYRLSNTTKPVGQLLRDDKAILLANALVDTARPVSLPIPDSLRAHGDPGSYIVQARGPLDDAFRALLREAGATVVAYIPNNAYLVRMPASVAQQLSAGAQTQTVLPYEPYYKLDAPLLKLAVTDQPLPEGAALNLLLFGDATEATTAALKGLGAVIIGQDRSPFGPVLCVQPTPNSLAALAALPGVQTIERFHQRISANDLSRVRIGITTNTTDGATNNYLGLTGVGVLVNVNDTGVDQSHPDLLGRVFSVLPSSLVDSNGHGTHVAGIIASSGINSMMPPGPNNVGTNASGSVLNADFRGMAPSATIFAMPLPNANNDIYDLVHSWFFYNPGISDAYLQETAAQTNAFISNNSWNYAGDYSYGLAAASYDAAVRDALPAVTGSQPLLFVFSAGNDAESGGTQSNDNGTEGAADSILSPGTAKNVITVGAIEQLRNITNAYAINCQTLTNDDGSIATNADGSPMQSCDTNTPWLAKTDSDNQVASFSSRGNVGYGIEGSFGRFKPDLVAPGVFVVSTRSGQWDKQAYYNPTNHDVTTYTNILVTTNSLFTSFINIPVNTVQFVIGVVPNENSPFPFPNLPIYVKQPGLPTLADSPVGTNLVSIPPDGGLALTADNAWGFGIGNGTTQAVTFDFYIDVITTNDNGNSLRYSAI